MTSLLNKTKKMLRKLLRKSSMTLVLKWTRLVMYQSNTHLPRMKTTWIQSFRNTLLKVRTNMVIILELISSQKTKHMKHQWISSWNGMIYLNRMLRNIWSRNSIKIGPSSMSLLKAILIRLKPSNLKGSWWEHSLHWPMELIPHLLMVAAFQINWTCSWINLFESSVNYLSDFT